MPSAILAVSSLDRYTTGGVAPQDTSLINLYSGLGQPGNNFLLESSSALIYGYINTLIVSQIQIDYRIPTIVPSNDVFSITDRTLPLRKGNDTFLIGVTISSVLTFNLVTIPYGFYNPPELATMLQALLQAVPGLNSATVIYTNANVPGSGAPIEPGYGGGNGFVIETNNANLISFPTVTQMLGSGASQAQIIVFLKTYRTLGIESSPTGQPPANYYLTQSPNFLFTSYLDIQSFNLTKFQKIKDTDTSTLKRSSLIARTYLSAIGDPQSTSSLHSVGSEPFLITMDLNSAKVIQWSPDETIYSLDFAVYDQYGDLAYWHNNYPTEFQITLLCSE